MEPMQPAYSDTKVQHFVSGNHDHDTWWMLIKLAGRLDQTMINMESVTKSTIHEKQ